MGSRIGAKIMAVKSSHSICTSLYDDGEPGDTVPTIVNLRHTAEGFTYPTLRFAFGDTSVYVAAATNDRFVEIVRSLYADLGAILQSEDHDEPERNPLLAVAEFGSVHYDH
jgi:hypothetical protein